MKKISIIFIATMLMGLLIACTPTTAESKPAQKSKTTQAKEALKQLEKKYGSELGVYAVNPKNSQTLQYNAQERFAFVSTYKAIASGVLLKNLTEQQLEKCVFFKKEDLVDYSPVTEKHVESGMTIKEIIHAAVAYSDNTAGNLLFNALNGPKGFQDELRKIKDETTNSDRYETELNTAIPGDPRDTSTPEAFAKNLAFLTKQGNLQPKQLDYFKQTLIENTTGDKLIRAGVPKGYIVGDKTGAGSYGTRNDIAVIYSDDQDKEPLVWVIFSKKDKEDAEYDDQLIADAAKVLSQYFDL
ncbi:class A beta-lactamase [Listeria booriae]|uniref:Beta-lactamase n=1 Tax=Listeria booriae TaxID=1552123 RepID=A0A842AEQ2_9LIST|nr:class A beta-lactamase [Listeria booriae]MBC1401350.1 class A beta-lactamase [Listeria booriae]MBC1616363.1 class A beta-lactamase [Listeria booriae]